jgi:hypothetical protein
MTREIFSKYQEDNFEQNLVGKRRDKKTWYSIGGRC